MKKLLAIFATMGITATSGISVVACGWTPSTNTDENTPPTTVTPSKKTIVLGSEMELESLDVVGSITDRNKLTSIYNLYKKDSDEANQFAREIQAEITNPNLTDEGQEELEGMLSETLFYYSWYKLIYSEANFILQLIENNLEYSTNVEDLKNTVLEIEDKSIFQNVKKAIETTFDSFSEITSYSKNWLAYEKSSSEEKGEDSSQYKRYLLTVEQINYIKGTIFVQKQNSVFNPDFIDELNELN